MTAKQPFPVHPRPQAHAREGTKPGEPREQARPDAQPASPSTAAAALVSLRSSADKGLPDAEARVRLAQDGPNDVPKQRPRALLQFARKFWGLSAWMLELIALLSFALHKLADLWIAMALLVVNAVLSFLQEQRASATVTALRSRLRVSARVLRDGTWQSVSARDLVRGDVVRLRAGDFVPADVQIIEGKLQIDQSALTGESQEVARSSDDRLFAGSTVREGEAATVVIETGVRTYFGRTTQLVESAHPKLHIEEVITRVVRWLFLIVGILVAITVAVSLIEGARLIEILPLSLVLLMSAVPVALPVMFTVSMAVGSMELARRGVLVTRLSAAEDAATMDVVCADKTGTLTMNRLTLAGVQPQPGRTADDVIRDAALASNEADQDPIDLAFLRAARERNLLGAPKVLSFIPFSPKTRRTEAWIEREGRRRQVVKGALRTVAEAAGLEASSIALLEAQADAQSRKGFRVLGVACAEQDGPLALVGLAFLHDAPRPDSRRLIDELKSLGVTVKMLTGDALPVAREVAREIGLGEIVRAPELRDAQGASAARAGRLVQDSDGFAEVFPEDKFLVIRCLQEAGHIVGMTGDGVNDAPALRQAEVGIAVAAATDVAKGAASVVLTTDGLANIVDLVSNGRAIYQRVLTWIVNKVSRTILKSGLVVTAFLLTGKFIISALGMVMLVFMTDFVKIALSTDRARGSGRPESWNIGSLVILAVALGLLMLLQSGAALWFAWTHWNLGAAPGRLQAFTFELLLFFALFSILSIRERRAFWRSWPSPVLALALGADALVGLGLAFADILGLQRISLDQVAFILATAAGSMLLNDAVKVVWMRRIERSRSRRVETRRAP